MATKRLKNWFFKTSQTALKKGTRLKNGDKPPQITFEDFAESILFKTETGDSAKEDTGTFSSDTAGHVSLATDAQAKAGYAKPADRAIATQPSQLPTVDTNDQLIITSNNLPVAGETISITETSETNNNYVIGLSDTIKNFFISLVTFVDSLKISTDTLSTELQALTDQVAQLSVSAGDGNVLLGSIVPWLSASVPADYLLLNGQEVSKTTYASLLLLLGTSYGTAEDSNNFVLPDLRGRALKGYDFDGPDLPQINPGGEKDYQDQILGQLYGSESEFIQTNNLPPHTHSAGDLIANLEDPEQGEYGLVRRSANDAVTSSASFDSSTTEPDILSTPQGQQIPITGNTGTNSSSGTSLNVTNPAILVNYIIRAL